MSDNARELLKEARLAMLRSQPDEQIETIKRIDAYLVAPSESAMEILERVRLGGYALNANDPDDRGPNGDDYHFTFSDSDAAALIEGLQRRVPRAMLEDMFNAAHPMTMSRARQINSITDSRK